MRRIQALGQVSMKITEGYLAKYNTKHFKAMLDAGCTFTVSPDDREPSTNITEGIHGLLATIAAKDEEIARLKTELELAEKGEQQG